MAITKPFQTIGITLHSSTSRQYDLEMYSLQTQLSFADLLKVQTSGNDGNTGRRIRPLVFSQRTDSNSIALSPTMGLIPPTPEDVLNPHSFAWPFQYATSHSLPHQSTLLTSPPPIETGIMCQFRGADGQLENAFRRPLRADSPSSHLRPNPYDRSSRQSSVSMSSSGSGSRAGPNGKLSSSDWQWESGGEDSGGSRANSRQPSPAVGGGCLDRAVLLSLCPEERPPADPPASTNTDLWSDSVRTPAVDNDNLNERYPIKQFLAAGNSAYSNDDQGLFGQAGTDCDPNVLLRRNRPIHRPDVDFYEKKGSSSRKPAGTECTKEVYVTPLTRSGKKSHARKVGSMLWRVGARPY